MKKLILLALFVSLIALTACKGDKKPKQEEKAPAAAIPTPLAQDSGSESSGGFIMDSAPMEMDGSAPKMILEVPDAIQNAWNTVDILVTDRITKKEETVTLKRGEDFTIKGSNINVKVTHFIPNFTMGSGVMTSLDEQPENPAIHIIVTEGEKELFKGVAFMRHPDTHAFTHEKYRVILSGYTSGRK
ncbi:hypothetical protein ACFL2A_03485 [Thermodesulfobacteriota bacterium]